MKINYLVTVYYQLLTCATVWTATADDENDDDRDQDEAGRDSDAHDGTSCQSYLLVWKIDSIEI